jgi:hypothetical protein
VKTNRTGRWLGVTLASAALLVLAPVAEATIDGVTGGTSFQFVARDGYISTPDGGSIYCWGYGITGTDGDIGLHTGDMQYPGPTLIVNQGVPVTITLTSEILDTKTPDPTDYLPVSLIFPGHSAAATGGAAGAITNESTGPADTVTYTFTPDSPGTYLYHSGTDPKVQVEMGLLGVIVVRPAGFDPSAPTAYGTEATAYGHEYLFLHSEMDPRVHQHYEFGHVGPEWDNTEWFSVYWFLNGRAAPDDLLESYVPWLPHQPYNITPRAHPGDKVLMRVVGAGRESHPFHHHGDHAQVIAEDGQLLDSDGVGELDLAYQVFTIMVNPGQTTDALFDWTGEKMGWDIYGDRVHDCIDGVDNDTGLALPVLPENPYAPGDGYADTELQGCDPAALTPCYPYEWCEDHDLPIPVTLPETQNLAFGAWWSGSPYLGTAGSLPPGEGGLNPNSGYPFMWHSHTEKELTNNDIFPGGMLTMFFIEPHGVAID